MAMSNAIQDTISTTAKLCKELLELEGDIEQLDTLVNGTPNYAAQITDANIATVPSFAANGLTAAQVLDAIYCLKMARAAFMQNLPSVTVLAHQG